MPVRGTGPGGADIHDVPMLEMARLGGNKGPRLRHKEGLGDVDHIHYVGRQLRLDGSTRKRTRKWVVSHVTVLFGDIPG